MDALQKYLDSARGTLFKWGFHDCCMFPLKGKDAQLGSDYAAAAVSFGCDSALAYRRIIRGTSLKTLACKVFGKTATGEIERGDIVLVSVPGVESLGIATPPVVLIAAAVGYAPVPMSAVAAHWKLT